VLFAILALVAVETTLRVTGYGVPASPFLIREHDGETRHVYHRGLFDTFCVGIGPEMWALSEFSVAASKPPDVFRIFVFGGGQAWGWPDPKHSFWRILEAMLEEAYPEMRFEVYCAAYPFFDSTMARELARHCARMQPDLFILYVGGNESFGVFGPLYPFRLWKHVPSRLAVKAEFALRHLRAYQWLLAQRTTSGHVREFFGAGEFGANDVEAMYERLRDNLDAVCKDAARAGARVVLCAEGSNLKDWPPQGAAPGSFELFELTPAWRAHFDAGLAREEAGDYAGALAAYQQALALEPKQPRLHFRMGTCLLHLGDTESARRSFDTVLHYDGWLFARSRPRARAILEEVAGAHAAAGASFADAAHYLTEASPEGIPGCGLFFDSVHPTFEGAYPIARALFPQVAMSPRLRAAGVDDPPEPLGQEACARRLAYTPERTLQLIQAELAKAPGSEVEDRAYRATLAEWAARLEARSPVADDAHGLPALREGVARRPNDFYLRADLAHGLIVGGLNEEALTHTSELLDRFPFRSLGQALHARALAGAGRQREACAAFAAAGDLNPGLIEVNLGWGNSLAALGEWEQAIGRLEQAIALAPQNVHAHALLLNTRAEAMEAQGRPAEAIALYREVIRHIPDHVSARLRIARLETARGELAAAKTMYREIIAVGVHTYPAYEELSALYLAHGDLAGLEREWREAVTRDATNMHAHFSLGLALERQGDLAAATAAYEEALRLSPGAGGTLEALERVLTARAESLGKQGAHDEAVVVYRRLLQIAPDHVPARLGMAGLEAARGDIAAAKVLYREVIATQPHSYPACEGLSALYLAKNDLAGLEREWRDIVTRDAKNMHAHFFLGLALERQGDLPGAAAAYEEALALAPESSGTIEALERVLVAHAESLAQQGARDEAMALYRRLLARIPGSAPALLGTARLEIARGDVAAAKAAYRELIARQPQTYPAYEGLSALYLAENDLAGLEREWRDAVARDAANMHAQFSLGLTLERRGDLPGAAAAYEAALTLSPESRGTREALERVRHSTGAVSSAP
jgi:tetratricopeptide (TPR) repeat protein